VAAVATPQGRQRTGTGLRGVTGGSGGTIADSGGRIHEICSVMQSGRKFGMSTMEQSMADLVQQGIIDPDAKGR